MDKEENKARVEEIEPIRYLPYWTLNLNCGFGCIGTYYVNFKIDEKKIVGLKLTCSICKKEYEYKGELVRKE